MSEPTARAEKASRYGAALRLVSLAGCGLLWLATWEFAARIEDWLTAGASPWRPYAMSALFRASPVGREGVPNTRFGKWRMNRLGFRGDDPVPGRANVLAIGASETFGQYESPAHEYPRLVEDELAALVPDRYNVVNAALPGMRLGRIPYLERALMMTHPRYVIIYPTPAHYIGVEKPFCHEPARPLPMPPDITDELRIIGRLERWARRVVPAPLMHGLRELDLWRLSWNVHVIRRVPDASVAAFKGDLECAIDTIEALGAVPLLLTHASYFGTSGQPPEDAWPMLVAWRRSYPELSEEGFLDLEHRANSVVREVAAKRGVSLFDAALAISPGPEHFADFVHFTDRGSRKMAQAIVAMIARHETLSGRLDPRSTGAARPRARPRRRRCRSHGPFESARTRPTGAAR